MYSKVSLASLSNNLNNQFSNISLGLLLKLTLLSFSQIIFRIQEYYFKNGRTSAVLNPHDSLLHLSNGMGLKLELQISMLKGVLIKVFLVITVKRILDEVSCKLADKLFYCC